MPSSLHFREHVDGNKQPRNCALPGKGELNDKFDVRELSAVINNVSGAKGVVVAKGKGYIGKNF